MPQLADREKDGYGSVNPAAVVAAAAAQRQHSDPFGSPPDSSVYTASMDSSGYSKPRYEVTRLQGTCMYV